MRTEGILLFQNWRLSSTTGMLYFANRTTKRTDSQPVSMPSGITSYSFSGLLAPFNICRRANWPQTLIKHKVEWANQKSKSLLGFGLL